MKRGGGVDAILLGGLRPCMKRGGGVDAILLGGL